MNLMLRLLAAVIAVGFVSLPVLAKDDEEQTYKKIEAQLNGVTLDTVSYVDADLQDVVKDFAKRGSITIVIDKKALEGVSEESRKITLELSRVKLGNALNIVLDQVGLFKSYKNGVLYLTTKEKAQGSTVTKTYDVRDITAKVTDFPAPEIKLKDDNQPGGSVIIPEEKETPTTDDIVEMIKDTVEADWDNTARITIAQGQLIIKAPREVHKQVKALLDDLRASK